MSRDIKALVRAHLEDLIKQGDWIAVTEKWAAKYGYRAEWPDLSRRERAEWNRILRGLIKKVTR